MTTSYSLFPLGINDAWLLPVLCLGAFFVIAMWGKYLPGKGSLVSAAAIGLGFVIFWFVLKEYIRSGPGIYGFTWFSTDGFRLNIAMNVDALTLMMLGLVTSVATLIQIYSIGYMRGDPRFPWYFAAHSLFAAAMLGLVLAENFLILYVSWELVGLCSYLLIGYYYERRSAAEAAKKAFITTRIGDVGLLIGVLVLWKATGTFSIPDIMHKAAAGEIARSTMTWSAILVFLGAMGKSAQFPFHVWLPDAMEGPTPVSALIHAATMVTAGVYLVARAFPLFEAAPGALELVMAVGIFTAILAATMGLVMTDIKKVLAYSTISQLGFMMMSLGAFGYTAGIFHLIAHGFFKALLFLGAGSVIHSTENQEMDKLGGLWRKMPITAITFGIATLAMAGIPPLSGFFS
ncbi:MAG: NADH-quinone oxidoreductase subunit L, partial [Chloroflexi bacterium]|nr:NADH-quinone oxidoreductase subunit L [Chloroflexota bacterium]